MKSKLTQLCKWAKSQKGAKYAKADFMMKCLSSHDSPAYLRLKPQENFFFTRPQPKIGQTQYTKKPEIHGWT